MVRSRNERIDEVDLLVVGSGFSGLAAAIEAFDNRASVAILEKQNSLGGNSIIAGGGVNAVDPGRQIPQGISDSLDLHQQQTYEGGYRLGDPEKIRFVVENALGMCVEWLEGIGVSWPQRVTQGFGALWERAHHPARYEGYREGAAIINAELDQVKKRKISILSRHKVIRIVREKILSGKVLGVEVETKGKKLSLRAKKGVILATGGFAANLEMVTDHNRELGKIPTTNHPGATGECIKMAQDIGADVVGMDYIQCVPITARALRSPFGGRFFSISSKEIRDSGSTAYEIFVNKKGDRFIREDGQRDEITRAIFAQQSFEPISIVETDNIAELERRLQIREGNLVKTIEKYNSQVKAGCDSDFGKRASLLRSLETPPFKGETKTLGRHYTMGGLKVQGITGRVVDRWGKIIPHFYGVGEVTGGFHGANRVGHNSTVECIVFGRVVGKLAAART